MKNPRLSDSCHPMHDFVMDVEAENARLRVALALSESTGEQRDLVAQELKHRIGNLLAVVQAIARQTFREADEDHVADFDARLVALAGAQKVLIDSRSRAAMLKDVVAAALAPHFSEGARCRTSGPDVSLDGRRAHALTLALHELATNASKYGALSNDAGWIEVTWLAEGRLDFIWREHDGPPVTTPTRRGFGSLLVTRSLGVAFAGEVELSFDRSGVQCRLRAPLMAA